MRQSVPCISTAQPVPYQWLYTELVARHPNPGTPESEIMHTEQPQHNPKCQRIEFSRCQSCIGGIGIPGAGPLPSTAAIDLVMEKMRIEASVAARRVPRITLSARINVEPASSAPTAVFLGTQQELLRPVPMVREVPADRHSLETSGGTRYGAWHGC